MMSSRAYRCGKGKAVVRRSAFTLVELLVALALTMFIMSILSEAFFAGVKVFRDFKAIGDMNGRLRTATRLLLDDLATPHFESTHKLLSDPAFWTAPSPAGGPPASGFFRIGQQAASTLEGSDLDGVPSYTNSGPTGTPTAGTQGYCWLHFAVNKTSAGNLRSSFYRSYPPAAVSGSTNANSLLVGASGDSRFQDYVSGTGPTGDTYSSFNSQWAEVAWFVQQSGNTISNPPGVTGSPTNLYTLYRRQRVAYPAGLMQPASVVYPATGYETVSCEQAQTPGTFYFNSPPDLTVPPRRFGMAGYTSGTTLVSGLPTTSPLPTTDNAYAGLFPTGSTYPTLSSPLQGNDVVLTDVISFDVRILIPGNSDFVDLFDTSVVPFGIYQYSSMGTNYYGPMNPNFAYITAGTPATSVPPFTAPTTGPLVFDTWSQTADTIYNGYSGFSWNALSTGMSSAASAPLQTPILAIKVSIRIWDSKSEQARQVSVISAFTQ